MRRYDARLFRWAGFLLSRNQFILAAFELQYAGGVQSFIALRGSADFVMNRFYLEQGTDNPGASQPFPTSSMLTLTGLDQV